MTSVLLPEPETPVTQVNTPIGNETLTSLRLFSDAPSIFINPLGFLLFSGIGMVYSLERYFPVSDLSFFTKSWIFPVATTSPPFSPAPGPISTMKSAFLIVSSSCSTTMIVFPLSLRVLRVLISFRLSLG